MNALVNGVGHPLDPELHALISSATPSFSGDLGTILRDLRAGPS